uniref:Transmembrane protein 234 n=1 Tax=Leptobrachium leishanense TaxID=445787 RepID=A0A8C5LUK9_9ANUR
MSLSATDLLSLILVSILWGATNPFLRKGAEGLERVKEQRSVRQFLSEARFLVSNWRYVIPFMLNQSGSVVFYLTLASAELSLAVPVCNSLALVFTTVTGKLLGEDIGGKGKRPHVLLEYLIYHIILINHLKWVSF